MQHPISTECIHDMIEEPPGGWNHGRQAATRPTTDGRMTKLSTDEAQTREFLRNGGWLTTTSMPAHRGILHLDEYVDKNRLQATVEVILGFTASEVHGVYRQGRLSHEQRDLRDRLDARLLAVSQAGGNMMALAAVLGLRMRPHGCHAIDGALSRARAGEAR